MPEAFINRIATANPPHDVHHTFLRFGQLMLKSDNRRVALFDRMAERSGISHRYSFLEPDPGGEVVDTEGFYRRLLEDHGCYVGPGHWFERPDTHFRLGYGWPTAEELEGGLQAISAALRG